MDQTSYVTVDGAVHSIDPSAVFDVPHPGTFRSRVTFATQNYDPATGQYVQPNLVPIWSVRNSDFNFVHKTEWLGDDSNQTPMTMLYFDPASGLGQAQLEIPIARFVGDHTYAPFPQGPTFLVCGFGEQGSLSVGENGLPVNFDHYSIFQFSTDYPDLSVSVDQTLVGEGERMQITMIMQDSTPTDSTLQVNVVGSAEFQLEDGGPINNWTLSIPQGTRYYALDVVAQRAGSALIDVTLNGTTVATSQWTTVSNQIGSVMPEDATSDSFVGGGSTDDSTYGENKRCRPAKCSPIGGDRLKNCTRPFVELVEGPITPDCKGPRVGFVIQAACVRGEEECEITGTELITCQRYNYAGTTDRSCGEVAVGGKISVEGEVNWIIAKAKTTAEFSTTVMSPITRRCCKYTPAPGESGNFRVDKCN